MITQDFEKNYDAKSNTYFFDSDITFAALNTSFITSANIVVFGDIICNKSLEAPNIIVRGDITAHNIKADRVFCTNLFSNEIDCTSIVANEEINGNILNADNVRCDTLDIEAEITAKKIISNVMQVYKGQKVDCQELHTVKYYT